MQLFFCECLGGEEGVEIVYRTYIAVKNHLVQQDHLHLKGMSFVLAIQLMHVGFFQSQLPESLLKALIALGVLLDNRLDAGPHSPKVVCTRKSSNLRPLLSTHRRVLSELRADRKQFITVLVSSDIQEVAITVGFQLAEQRHSVDDVVTVLADDKVYLALQFEFDQLVIGFVWSHYEIIA